MLSDDLGSFIVRPERLIRSEAEVKLQLHVKGLRSQDASGDL